MNHGHVPRGKHLIPIMSVLLLSLPHDIRKAILIVQAHSPRRCSCSTRQCRSSAEAPARNGADSLGRLGREVPGVVLRPVRDAEHQDGDDEHGQRDGKGPAELWSTLHRQLGVPLGPGPVDGPSLAVV